MSHGLKLKLDGPIGFMGFEPSESVADLDRASRLLHFADPDEKVGMRIVSRMHQLSDRHPITSKGFGEQLRSKCEDVDSRLQLAIVAVSRVNAPAYRCRPEVPHRRALGPVRSGLRHSSRGRLASSRCGGQSVERPAAAGPWLWHRLRHDRARVPEPGSPPSYDLRR